MANMIKFYKGALANLPDSGASGALYITTDEGAIYLGQGEGSALKRLGDFVQVASVSALPTAGANENALYYCVSENILAKWNGSDWSQINKDTGMTSVDIAGEGNSVTAASYDATTRKLTLTKGETFATKAALDELDQYVGEIPSDEKYADISTIVGYINKKAEETLASAQGGSSETAASVKAALDTYIEENDIAVKANADAIDAIEADYLKKADKEALQTNIDLKAAQTDLNGAVERITALEDANKDGGAVASKIADAQAAADAAQLDVDNLEKAVGEVPAEKTVIGLIGEAQAKAEQGVADAATAQAAAEAAQGDVNDLGAKIGEVADGKTVVKMIEEAQAAATYDDTELSGRVATIEGDYLKAADKTELAGKIKSNADAIELLTNGVSAEEVDGVNDLIQYVKDHGSEVTGMQESIAANAKAIADQATSDAATYETKEDAGKKLTEAKQHATDLNTAMDTRVKVLEKIDHDAYVEADKTVLSDAKAHADGLNTAMNTRVEALEAIDHEHANKAELDLIASGDKAKWDEAAGKAHEHANAAELAKIADGDVAKWNSAQANAEATAAAALSGAKTELEGKISDAESAAKTHAETKVSDLATGAVAANTAAISVLNGSGEGSVAKALADAKAYADTAESDAVTTANAYTDSALTWDSF